jgi:hypothetical protein
MDRMKFFVLDRARHRESTPASDHYASTVLPGFKLNQERVRRLF